MPSPKLPHQAAEIVGTIDWRQYARSRLQDFVDR
jgi:hypothetical protein